MHNAILNLPTPIQSLKRAHECVEAKWKNKYKGKLKIWGKKLRVKRYERVSRKYV